MNKMLVLSALTMVVALSFLPSVLAVNQPQSAVPEVPAGNNPQPNGNNNGSNGDPNPGDQGQPGQNGNSGHP